MLLRCEHAACCLCMLPLPLFSALAVEDLVSCAPKLWQQLRSRRGILLLISLSSFHRGCEHVQPMAYCMCEWPVESTL